MRRIVHISLILALLAPQGLVEARNFADVQNTPYKRAFEALSSKGIVEGYRDGLARPGYALNRAEALKVVLLALGDLNARIREKSNRMPPLPLFSDISQSAWYAPYVEIGFEEGTVQGYPDNTFRPGRNLTVEEAVTLLIRSFTDHPQMQNARVALLSPRIENRDAQWYTTSINSAIEHNLIQPADTLRLGRPISRGQFFSMVYRVVELRERGLEVYSEPQQIITVSPRAETRGSHPVIQPSNPPIVQQPSQSQFASQKHFAITLPNLGIDDLAVLHPEDAASRDSILSVLQDGVGHLFSFPGGGGKIMIYGHSSGYPWDVSQYTKIFRKINKLNIGDKVYVTYDGTLHTYEVSHKQTIDAEDTSPFDDDGTGEELILYTCWPPDSIAQRYLVHAVPVSTQDL